MRQIHCSAAGKSARHPFLQGVAESSAKKGGRHPAPLRVFARFIPFRIVNVGVSAAGLTSLPRATNVCGDDSQLSPPGVQRRREDVAEQGLHADSCITFHREVDLCCSMAWFTLIDAQLRPSGSFGFAPGSFMPQYEAGRADSQGGLQSFRS